MYNEFLLFFWKLTAAFFLFNQINIINYKSMYKTIWFLFSKCDVYKKKKKKLIITNTRCDIVRWHTQVCAQVKIRKKRNQMMFILKWEKKEERFEIKSCSFTILCTKRESNIIDFVDDNRLFYSLFSFFFIQKRRIDIKQRKKLYTYI
jgi:hypothetical protein